MTVAVARWCMAVTTASTESICPLCVSLPQPTATMNVLFDAGRAHFSGEGFEQKTHWIWHWDITNNHDRDFVLAMQNGIDRLAHAASTPALLQRRMNTGEK